MRNKKLHALTLVNKSSKLGASRNHWIRVGGKAGLSNRVVIEMKVTWHSSYITLSKKQVKMFIKQLEEAIK